MASYNDLIFTSSSDETIKMWDTSRMACVRTLQNDKHGGVVHALAINEGRLYSGDSFGYVCLGVAY